MAFMVRNSIPQRETREITVEDVRADARTVQLSFSSELPVQREWGTEILSHENESVDLSRLNSGASALLDHDPTKFVGKVELSFKYFELLFMLPRATIVAVKNISAEV